MQRRMQRRMQMRGGGEITQQILDALEVASKSATRLADELTQIAKPAKPDADASVGGTKKRKLKTRRRKTMKR